MTADDVKRRVEQIRDIWVRDGDEERCHSMEDELRSDVLFAIADGVVEDPEAVASAALRTDDIKFARWCA